MTPTALSFVRGPWPGPFFHLLTLALFWSLAGLSGGPTRVAAAPASGDAAAIRSWLSPQVMVASREGERLYLACATAAEVAVFDAAQGRIVQRIPTPSSASGLALSGDGARLFVTCDGAEGSTVEVELARGVVTRTFAGRHTPMAPVLSADGRTLFVCHRFSACVSVYDLAQGQERHCIAVDREPICAALTLDGQSLLVGHHLPSGRADADHVGATITVIDVKSNSVAKTLALPNGSTLLREIRISPDGAYACVSHNLARFQMPTTQLERGWMNTSALTIIDLKGGRVLNTVLLDDVDHGAANPWALAWAKGGQLLAVTHAGTHELSLIRFPELLEKLSKMPTGPAPGTGGYSQAAAQTAADVVNDLAFLVGLRDRVQLTGTGPRSVALLGNQLWVAGYFSDTLERVDPERRSAVAAIALHGSLPVNAVRQGEMHFNDARLCFQQWQSCATCHSQDARVDGLNWDLLNDGIGNPKNGKSLLLVHRTPPAMSTGVRETGETAVRAGIRHILFTVQPESVAQALDAWLKSLRPLPSPGLVHGQLSAAAQRGQRLFHSKEVGCVDCHKPELWTDLQPYDVGTAGRFDREVRAFDTPTLVEVWRTAPYLHDGSAATLREVLTTRNRGDHHGRTSHLSASDVDDLVAYLSTL